MHGWKISSARQDNENPAKTGNNTQRAEIRREQIGTTWERICITQGRIFQPPEINILGFPLLQYHLQPVSDGFQGIGGDCCLNVASLDNRLTWLLCLGDGLHKMVQSRQNNRP